VAELEARAAATTDLAAMTDVFEDASPRAQALLERWIAADATWVAVHEGTVVGFVVAECTFFDNEFVEMLRVTPSARRLGAASLLLSVVSRERRSAKLFTSTNLSNTPMQSVLAKLNWQSAGIVYGLDEGDPELFYIAPSQ